MIDPNDVLRFRDPNPGSSPRVIGVWPGPKEGAYHSALTGIKTATERFLGSAFDTRLAPVGPIEAGRRIREQSGPMLKEFGTQAAKLVQQRDRLSNEMRSATAAVKYERAGHWVPQWDLRLIDALNAMGPGKRQGVIAQLLHDPLADTDTAEALQRVPLAISGLTWEQRNALRVAQFKAMKPEEFERLEIERTQLETAQRALRLAVGAVMESGCTRADIIAHAPTVDQLIGPEVRPADWGPLDLQPQEAT